MITKLSEALEAVATLQETEARASTEELFELASIAKRQEQLIQRLERILQLTRKLYSQSHEPGQLNPKKKESR